MDALRQRREPTNLFAEFALRTKQKIGSIAAEFPRQSQIESLGAKGGAQLFLHISGLLPDRYQVRDQKGVISSVEFKDGLEKAVAIPMEPESRPKPVTIAK